MKKYIRTMTGLAVVFSASLALAASENIDAVAEFETGISVGNEQHMAFNIVNYSAAPGAGDLVSLGTNGAITYGGANFSGLGTGTPGRVDVTTGTNGLTVEVYCDTSATLSDGAAGRINAISLEVSPENSLGAYGTGQPCNGISGAPATNLILNTGVLDTFVLGGRLDGSTAINFGGGSFSTTNAGGDNVQVDVFYQ